MSSLLTGLLVNDTLRILKIGKNPMQTAGAFGILIAVKQNSASVIESLDFTDIVVSSFLFNVLKKQIIPLKHLNSKKQTNSKVKCLENCDAS